MLHESVSEFQPEPWQLDDLFTGLQATDLAEALTSFQTELQAFVSGRESLTDTISPGQFNEMLAEYDALAGQMRLISGIASLKFSGDTQDQAIQAELARIQQASAKFNNQTLYFLLWWQGLSEEKAATLQAAVGDWGYWLAQLRAQTPYTLSEAEEQLSNLKDVNGRQALLQLYSSLTNRYEFKLEVDGETHTLTREALSAYFRHPDKAIREASYRALLDTYAADETILGQIYQALVRDWYSENVEIRGYPSAISVRNQANDIPDKVVDVLLEVTREQAGLFQRYFRLRAQMLGEEQLRRFDLGAPTEEVERKIDYQESIEMVMRAFGQYDGELAELAYRVFADHHYDGEVRAGKRSGAFCMSPGPGYTPYILHSFTGRLRDLSTMAHELGHAIHALLAAHHNVLTFHSSLPLAETASTFAEMLVMDMLLSDETDPAVERNLLMEQMDNAYATIMRQAEFARFELIAHEMIREGATVSQVSERYLGELQAQFGEAVSVDDVFRYEWLVVPHFYGVPFYVYAYAFGQLLVLSLYRQYKAEGEAFKPRFREILAAGGSAAPVEILAKAGI
ncbi:MAG: M3 family oligoendopeptidase, partial [Anaerolineales bacterium]|nr:M3 family oligoendopeptidase [Anaerolineales bacterium]